MALTNPLHQIYSGGVVRFAGIHAGTVAMALHAGSVMLAVCAGLNNGRMKPTGICGSAEHRLYWQRGVSEYDVFAEQKLRLRPD